MNYRTRIHELLTFPLLPRKLWQSVNRQTHNTDPFHRWL